MGKTELTGAQITSTQAAIDQGKNRYEAKQGTSTTDLPNSARYEAKSVSVGLGAGTPAPGKSLSAGLSGVGIGSDSGSASSTSTAGISGVASDLGARTGDKEAGLKPIFDKDKARLHLLICRSLLLKRRGVDMLFPNTSLEELTSDKVYEFSDCKPVYLALLKYYSDLYDYPFMAEKIKNNDADYRNGRIWWVMNEGWKSFGTLNPILPMAWLSISKRALYWDHIPVNFYPVALAILEKFDLERYQKAYQLPQEEYEAMKRDLPVVLEGLRNYPADKLAPPMDEDNWGYNDQ